MNVDFSSDTLTGTKHRDNEDRLICEPELGLFVVADGMSGAEGGALASELATEALKECFRIAKSDDCPASWTQEMSEAIQIANHLIFSRSVKEPRYIGMGTTLTAVFLESTKITIGHVGDSRLCLYRDGRLTRLTEDDLLPDESGSRKILSQSVGLSDEVRVKVSECSLDEEALYLLGSDGIWDFLTDDEICGLLRRWVGSRHTLQQLPNEICKLAKLRGSDDDMSVITFSVKSLV